MWSNDDLPALGDDISLERCLFEARAAGFAGIELGHKFPRDPETLRARLGPHQLQLVSGWYGGRILERGAEAELRAAEAQIELLCRMGCETFIYAEVSGCVHGVRGQPLETRRRLASTDYADFGRELTAFAEGLRARGLSIAYHHHMGTVIQTIPELERLLAATGDVVGVTLDTGHVAFAGGEPAAVIRALGGRLRHLHLKDVRPTVIHAVSSGPSSYLDAIVDGVFTVPGDGALDFGPVVRALLDVDYRGWWVVEADQDPALADPGRFARMGFDEIAGRLRDHGLGVAAPPLGRGANPRSS